MPDFIKHHGKVGALLAGTGRVLCLGLIVLNCACKEEIDLKRQVTQVNIDIEDAKAKLDQTAVAYRKANEEMRDSGRDIAKLGPPSIAADKVRKLQIEVQTLEDKLSGGNAALEAMKQDMSDYKSKYLNQ